MKRIVSVLLVSLLAGATGALAGDPVDGVWVTPPDRKNLISHIRISACGDKICGVILSAYDASGKSVQTPHIGKQLFWGIVPEGGGKYGKGTVHVPLLDVNADASFVLSGPDTLKVKACKVAVCDHEVWTRLK